jgi:hypothetical protein
MSRRDLFAGIVWVVCALAGTTPDDAAHRAIPEYWSYQAVQRPSPPVPGRDSADEAQSSWIRNPIDGFIAAEHRRNGLQASPPAEPAVLLRRVYLDLIGLPPTREELLDFLEDPSETAYERVVERLLASPRYGERWGRHWMDVWRYSDWYGSRGGNEIRYSQRHIWRWRDWIVESLNEDKGYDQMIVEMLAGDELAPGDPSTARATGFLGRNWYKFDRNVWMFDAVEHTAQGFLALTLKCARCHEHKYDPISQEDYYRFRAFFEPHDVRTDPISGLTGTEKDATLGAVLKDGVARVYDKQLDVPTYLFARGDSRYPDEKRPLTAGVPAAFGFDQVTIQPVSLPPESYFPALRGTIVAQQIEAARRAVEAAQAKLAEATAARAAAERHLAEFIDQQSANLDQPDATPPQPAIEWAVKLAQRAARAAEQASVAARAELESLEARIAADRLKLAEGATTEPLASAAARAERQAKLARAEAAATEAENAAFSARKTARASAEAGNKVVAEAEDRLAAAVKAVEAARAESAKDDAAYSPIGPEYPRQSTGRRLALAHWIADRRNPRTARVAVNHIWMRHFGQPIVATVANFGMNGSRPSHPELLDWMAAELMDQRWSMKHLHRLIVSSNTYRMTASASGSTASSAAVDPDNRFLWRMNSRRMESELVRDSLLFLAGQLDSTLGGPEIEETLGQVTPRRSLYFRSTPNEKMSFLEVFDQANPNECYRRQESVMPQQSLALSNSALALNQARLLARGISSAVGAEDNPARVDAFIRAAFEHVLSRPATQPERAACARFLSRHAALLRNGSLTAYTAANAVGKVTLLPPAQDAHLRARENLVHVLLNHNDFVTIR